MIPIALVLGLLASQEAAIQPEREEKVRRLIEQIAQSGRVIEIAEPVSERAEPPRQLPPGDPPLLAFRYFEGKERHRFGQLDLMMDDAGH
jgi:hypothetical protein